MKGNKLKKVELDEIELYLNMLENDYKEKLNTKTYLEIARLIEKEFGVECDEQTVNLLYDPTLEQLLEDNEIFYKEIIGL